MLTTRFCGRRNSLRKTDIGMRPAWRRVTSGAMPVRSDTRLLTRSMALASFSPRMRSARNSPRGVGFHIAHVRARDGALVGALGGGVGGQARDVIEKPVRRVEAREVEHRRDEDHAADADALVDLQLLRDARRAEAAVAFAGDELGRRAAAVLLDPAADGGRQRVDVAVDAPQQSCAPRRRRARGCSRCRPDRGTRGR